MSRVALIFDDTAVRSSKFRTNLASAIETATEHELIVLLIRDEVLSADAIQQYSIKERVRIVHAQPELKTKSKPGLADRLLKLDADYYLFTDGSAKVNLSTLSNLCRGDRDVQIFGARQPYFFSNDPSKTKENNLEAKYSNIELFGLLLRDDVALSRAYLNDQNVLDMLAGRENVARVLDGSNSFTVNTAVISARSREYDWHFLSQKYAYNYFKSIYPEVARSILLNATKPLSIWQRVRKTKWAVTAKAYLAHFSEEILESDIPQSKDLTLPFQGDLWTSIENFDNEKLINLFERISKNRFGVTELRAEDFYDDPLEPVASSISEDHELTVTQQEDSASSVPATVMAKFSLQTDRLAPEGERAELSSEASERDGRLDFRLTAPGGFGVHRDGWAYVMQKLLDGVGHSAEGIGFDGFVEKTFVWNFGSAALGRNKSWIGITHRPPNIPSFYDWKSRLQFYESPYYYLAASQNTGLITVSSDHAEYLRRLLGKPVEAVLHPTNHDVGKWDPSCLSHRGVQVVQVGSWLRKLHSIFQLREGDFSKRILVKSKAALFENDRFQGEAEYLRRRGELDESVYDSVDFVGFLQDRAYDEMLSQSVVFLDLYDATANNTVLECIARHTPLVVRKLPATQEYLGKTYPLFFDNLDEAADLLEDKERLLVAHEYLKERAKLEDFHPHGFLKNVKRAIANIEQR